ncbi:hypothetical protein Afe04nite_04560 [Asanoa ferruginea]|nr:hypothetical protein Afe04nite_04560 [Asanoa ferruginea]
MARPDADSTANIAPSGRPGRASTRAATPPATAVSVSAARGRTRSATDSSVLAPTNSANDGPNMLRLASSGESVWA